MKLLIEDFPYPAEKVRGLLGGDQPFETEGVCRIHNVGYYYNPSIQDCVFVLPKVILDFKEDACAETVFGQFHPNEIIDINKEFRVKNLNQEQRDFIFNLSTWIYRAIAEFVRINEEHPEVQRSHIVFKKHYSNISLNGKNTEGTLIDIILSLIKFANENRDWFMFIIKNIHRGDNKINWTKTIATKTAFINENVPLYLEIVNKKKTINFDEELLVIFYSILRYVREKYGFPTEQIVNYKLIIGQQFDSYLSGLGKSRLLQIKYKYYSDKALQLWNLCYCFFAMIEQIAMRPDVSEYLFVSNFDIVFETMIDELISDKNIPSSLRDQRDGKVVDHIYSFQSLITPSNIYHIGDSKYYKIGASVHGNSEYKQYTYARNVIHFNLDLWQRYGADAPSYGALPYLDALTEGYNVTPNFFISSEIDHEYKYNEPGLHLHKANDGKSYAVSKHFNNRLFDRDTLWLSHYDINFLYVLALFVSPHQSVREEFKVFTRKIFRDQIINLLNEKYEFFHITIDNTKIELFVSQNFRELIGKVYHYINLHGDDILILALEKGQKDSEVLKNRYSTIINKFLLC